MKKFKKAIMGVSMAGLVSIAGFTVTAGPASATTVIGAQQGAADVQGDSGVLYGCMARWWSTAFNMTCDRPKVSKAGKFHSQGDCPIGNAYGPTVVLKKGHVAGWISPGECNISVKKAYVIWSK